jgi:hypothetical protein
LTFWNQKFEGHGYRHRLAWKKCHFTFYNNTIGRWFDCIKSLQQSPNFRFPAQFQPKTSEECVFHMCLNIFQSFIYYQVPWIGRKTVFCVSWTVWPGFRHMYIILVMGKKRVYPFHVSLLRLFLKGYLIAMQEERRILINKIVAIYADCDLN